MSFIEAEIVVVRHGETESNRTHIIQGHLDTPLSDVGVKQAECAAKHLADTKFDHALSSDLCRALKTGQVILDSNPSLDSNTIETWTVLRERSFGEFEGKQAKIMMDKFKELSGDALMAWGPQGGETGRVFRDRTRQFLKDLGQRVVKLEMEKPKVLVTSHGGFIKELNMVLVKEHGCSMPCEHGEYGRISPNTGISKFQMQFDKAGNITSVQCSLLYYKEHLEGLDVHEPLHYGV